MRAGSTDRWTACAMSIADLAAIGWSGSGHRMQIFMRRGARSALREDAPVMAVSSMHARGWVWWKRGWMAAAVSAVSALSRPPLLITNVVAAHRVCVCACMQLAAYHFVWLHTKSSALADADGPGRDCSGFAAGSGCS
ncbi:hypothetical protein L1887_58489 [Cichorium endivia]|nr:hypothetical protein L1887_58489 [Cichorium endivia]